MTPTIRLTDNPEGIDCRHDAIKELVLRAERERYQADCVDFAQTSGRHSWMIASISARYSLG